MVLFLYVINMRTVMLSLLLSISGCSNSNNDSLSASQLNIIKANTSVNLLEQLTNFDLQYPENWPDGVHLGNNSYIRGGAIDSALNSSVNGFNVVGVIHADSNSLAASWESTFRSIGDIEIEKSDSHVYITTTDNGGIRCSDGKQYKLFAFIQKNGTGFTMNRSDNKLFQEWCIFKINISRKY